jgi:hypothetical protein
LISKNIFGLLQIRDQFSDRLFIGLIENNRFPQLSLPFGRFWRQYMAGVGPAPPDFTRSRYGKPLRRTPMCFNLWHSITPIVKILNPLSVQAC